MPTVTLDWLATRFPLPNVVKIDVEDAEAKALAKAETVLQPDPKVICEVAGKNSTMVTRILTYHGYKLYDGNLPVHMRVPTPTAPPNTLGIRA